MKTTNKLVSAFFLLAIVIANAQQKQSPPKPDERIVGPGAASPIDMYVYALGVVAILLIIYFTKNYSLKKV